MILHLFEIPFANGILSLEDGTRAIKILRHQIEEKSSTKKLKFNQSRCLYLGMHDNVNMHSKGGIKIEKVYDTMTHPTWKVSLMTEGEGTRRLTTAD